jgi:hypothetical protein
MAYHHLTGSTADRDELDPLFADREAAKVLIVGAALRGFIPAIVATWMINNLACVMNKFEEKNDAKVQKRI